MPFDLIHNYFYIFIKKMNECNMLLTVTHSKFILMRFVSNFLFSNVLLSVSVINMHSLKVIEKNPI